MPGEFSLVAGNDVTERFPSKLVRIGEGLEGEAAQSGRSVVGEPGTAQEQVACVPLMDADECVGIIGIYRLFGHKRGGFTPIDHELLNMLAGQAAAAMTGSRLYGARIRPMQAM